MEDPMIMIELKDIETFYSGMEVFRSRMNVMFKMRKSDIKGKIPESISKWMEENQNTDE